MVDRIEELLAGLAAEDDEGQEDVLALGTAAVPASPRGGGGEAGAGEAEAEAGRPPVEMGERGGGRTAAEIVAERPGLIAGESAEEGPGRIAGTNGLAGPGMDAVTAEDGAKDTAEILQKDGAVWTVRAAAGMDAAQRPAPEERMERRPEDPQTAQDGGLAALAETVGRTVFTAARAGVEWAAQTRTAGPEQGEARGDAPERAGLEGLYRQTVRAVWPAAPALPRETAGRSARVREPGDAAALAVDELDRAVRRDSRRYDGGMSIF